jgi:urease alpha subunit
MRYREMTPFSGSVASYGNLKRAEAVKNCRKIGKKDMKHNNAMPKMTGMLSICAGSLTGNLISRSGS